MAIAEGACERPEPAAQGCALRPGVAESIEPV
jgi:hypothetical protein